MIDWTTVVVALAVSVASWFLILVGISTWKIFQVVARFMETKSCQKFLNGTDKAPLVKEFAKVGFWTVVRHHLVGLLLGRSEVVEVWLIQELFLKTTQALVVTNQLNPESQRVLDEDYLEMIVPYRGRGVL